MCSGLLVLSFHVRVVRPNGAVDRTRRFVASTWRASARRAGYLIR